MERNFLLEANDVNPRTGNPESGFSDSGSYGRRHERTAKAV